VPLFQTVTDLLAGAELLRRRRYGVIEFCDGRLRRVRLRPFPKIVSTPGIILFGGWYHRRWPGDRIWIYYNQPWQFRNFLVLQYVVSARQTSVATLCRGLAVLDEIARLKQSDAILCEVSNWRISADLLGRAGWVRHCPSRWHRHYIKRFYGVYPPKLGGKGEG
jgi:hypothetical protein